MFTNVSLMSNPVSVYLPFAVPVVNETVAKRGRIVIPAFAVGRT